MDLALNLFWSQEIPVAENYGFHLETDEGLYNITKMPCWKSDDILDLYIKTGARDWVAQD